MPFSVPVALASEARALAARLPPLVVTAARTAAARQGVHGKRRAGLGENFWQFRRYAPGDPAQRIDWRQSARTDKLFVREKEYEAAQRVYLWADGSGSMRYASDPRLTTKAARAQLLTMALASLLQRGGEQVCWLQAQGVLPMSGPQGLERIEAALAAAVTVNAIPPLPTVRQAQLILASDFLWPAEDLRRLLADAAGRGSEGVLLHIIDPAEEDFPFAGRVELQGCEGEAPLLLSDAAGLATAYHAQWANHAAQLRRLAQSAGWHYLRHLTDQPAFTALLSMHGMLGAHAG